jgi:phospholipid transport system substrate-binding protein
MALSRFGSAFVAFWLNQVLVLAFLVAALPALAGNSDAEKYAQHLIDRGFAILEDNSGGDAARRARFHDFVLQNVDARKTALFTLGQYRRGAPETDVEAFVTAFRDYATNLYETRLEERKKQELKVVGSVDNKPGDVTVNAAAKDPNASEPVRIALRLLGSPGNYKVVDVQAAGVWLSIEQRDQFATFLAKHNGDLKALTSHLIAQTAEMRGGKRAPSNTN